jgi:hypothetical protein
MKLRINDVDILDVWIERKTWLGWFLLMPLDQWRKYYPPDMKIRETILFNSVDEDDKKKLLNRY